MNALRKHLKQCMGLNPSSEGDFIACHRHLNAIERTLQHLLTGQQALPNNLAGEWVAEDLRQAQMRLVIVSAQFPLC